MVLLSLATTALELLVWAPTCAAGFEEFRPFGPMVVVMFLMAVGTVPGLVIGLYQVAFRRPRVWGLLSVASSTLPFLAVRLTTWLLLDLRGIHMGD